jgi:FkbM family methyltransferase
MSKEEYRSRICTEAVEYESAKDYSGGSNQFKPVKEKGGKETPTLNMAKVKIDRIIANVGQIETIVHVGANEGQEVPVYLAAGVKKIHLIEPIPEISDRLFEKFKYTPQVCISPYLCLDTFGDTEFFTTTNNGLSSSIYSKHDPYMHNIAFNQESIFVKTVTLDSLTDVYEKVDLLVIDAQGSEDRVLLGATETLKKTSRIFTEVSTTPLYEGACVLEQIDTILYKNGFIRTNTYLNERGTGDALYCPKE